MKVRRIDAEYAAHPETDRLEAIIASGKTLPLSEFAHSITSGHTPYLHDVSTGDIGFVTVECVGPLIFNPNKLKRITIDQYYNEFTKNKISINTVLCTIKRRICQSYAWIDQPPMQLAFNQDVALIVPKGILSGYLSTYLSCRIGQSFANRQQTEQMNPYISLENLRTLPIFRAEKEFQSKIEQVLRLSNEAIGSSQSFLEAAEGILLDSLGLADWNPPEPLSYIASSADAFASGRLDAQYFMPAKRLVRDALSAMPGQTLGQRFDSIRDMFDPKSDSAPALVRNYDVTDALQPILDDDKPPVATEEIGSMKKVFKDGDVAISRLRAYLREIAVVRTSGKLPSVGSSEFIVLRPRNKGGSRISPETLLTFLRSTPVQTILKWCQDGSQHPRFSESDLMSIHVPDAVADASPQIEAIVKQGFEARRRARELLDRAKRAVEIAIEDTEAAALRYLEEAGA